MIEDFDAHLAAMRVARERQLDAQFGGARKGIRIVREQNIGDIAPDERFHAGQHRQGAAIRVALALVVHADQVECASLPAQFGIFLAQQLHAKSLKKFRGSRFRSRVDFMVAVASPDAQRRAQPRKFGDAIFQRVGPAGHKIAGDDRQVAAQFIGHADSAAHLRDRHVRPDMNIAQLRDPHAVERRRKIRDGNFDFAHLEVESLGHKSVGHAHERNCAGEYSRGLKKVTPGMINVFGMACASRESR